MCVDSDRCDAVLSFYAASVCCLTCVRTLAWDLCQVCLPQSAAVFVKSHRHSHCHSEVDESSSSAPSLSLQFVDFISSLLLKLVEARRCRRWSPLSNPSSSQFVVAVAELRCASSVVGCRSPPEDHCSQCVLPLVLLLLSSSLCLFDWLWWLLLQLPPGGVEAVAAVT